jgi:hypothetical protein
MKELTLENLTQEQRNYLCNGCGNKGLGWLIPEFIFTEACDCHDIGYWVGGTKEDKRRVDRSFLKDMQDAVEESSWWKRRYYYTWCRLYYYGVITIGKMCFHYGKKKTWEDLEREMQELKGD